MYPNISISGSKSWLIVILLFITFHVGAQEKQLFQAFKQDNFTEVDPYLDNRIDLGIYDKQNLVPKAEAIQKIRAWIKANKVKSLTEIHSGQSSDQKSHYRVAQLDTEEGIFRVFVYISEKNGKNVIKKIQIDRF